MTRIREKAEEISSNMGIGGLRSQIEVRDRIEQALREERDAALEDAAKICNASLDFEWAANQIRALKSKAGEGR